VDEAGVAQGVGEFLAEERVAVGALVDQGGDRLGQLSDAEAVADQGQGVMAAQRLQRKVLGGRVLAELAVLAWQWLDQVGGPARLRGILTPHRASPGGLAG
jgi:hypothetical protein